MDDDKFLITQRKLPRDIHLHGRRSHGNCIAVADADEIVVEDGVAYTLFRFFCSGGVNGGGPDIVALYYDKGADQEYTEVATEEKTN